MKLSILNSFHEWRHSREMLVGGNKWKLQMVLYPTLWVFYPFLIYSKVNWTLLSRVGHCLLFDTNKIPIPILTIQILSIKYQYKSCYFKNVNKITIPILGLRRAIPYNSNSEPILSVWRILQPILSEILIPLTFQNPSPPPPTLWNENQVGLNKIVT